MLAHKRQWVYSLSVAVWPNARGVTMTRQNARNYLNTDTETNTETETDAAPAAPAVNMPVLPITAPVDAVLNAVDAVLNAVDVTVTGVTVTDVTNDTDTDTDTETDTETETDEDEILRRAGEINAKRRAAWHDAANEATLARRSAVTQESVKQKAINYALAYEAAKRAAKEAKSIGRDMLRAAIFFYDSGVGIERNKRRRDIVTTLVALGENAPKEHAAAYRQSVSRVKRLFDALAANGGTGYDFRVRQGEKIIRVNRDNILDEHGVALDKAATWISAYEAHVHEREIVMNDAPDVDWQDYFLSLPEEERKIFDKSDDPTYWG